MRLIFGTYQSTKQLQNKKNQEPSRSDQQKDERHRLDQEKSQQHTAKNPRHFPEGKEVGKGSTEVGRSLDKVLSDLVFLWPEPCSGQPRLGQRHPRVPSSQHSSALHGHVLEYFFCRRNKGCSRHPTLRQLTECLNWFPYCFSGNTKDYK